MAVRLRLLIVDDSDDDATLILRHLAREGYDVEHLRVDTRVDLLAALDGREWDVVICDYTIPGFSGLVALNLIRERELDLPFIFVSGTIGEETAVCAMRSGANDYVMKGDLRRLGPAIERELREAVSRRDRRRAEERLHFLAHHDPLTGLPNRLVFMERLQEALRKSDDTGRAVGVAFVDLDRFKAVNDTLGHTMGDRVLEAVADRLKRCTRPGDSIARLSGDEFTLVLTDMAGAEDAKPVSEKILAELAIPFRIENREIYLGASLGIALYPRDADDARSLVRAADGALQEAKQQGRSNCQFFTAGMMARAEENLALEQQLRKALEYREGLELYYQPIVGARTGGIAQLEALLRWQHPERGLLPGASFVPLSEEVGLIVPLGAWALEAAVRQAADWRRELGDDVPPVAVNVSAIQMRSTAFADTVETLLEQVGLPGPALIIELTETAVMEEPDVAARTLARLRELGVKVSLDDFGTGYSSLAHLRRLPLDHLKIDRSFVRHVPDEPDDTAIASTIVAMGRLLQLAVVAEGVETEHQAEFLRGEGCDLMQGHLFGRPHPASEIRSRIRERLAPATGAGASSRPPRPSPRRSGS